MSEELHPAPHQDVPHDAAFDALLRSRYREASAQLSPRTRAHLQQRLRAVTAPGVRTPPNSRRLAWGLAVACSLALVIVFGQRLQAPQSMHAPIAGAAGDNGELVAALDETPDLYLWVASDDATAMASE